MVFPMGRQEAEQVVDPLLIPFLEATDESQARDQLDQLVTRVTPLVEKITDRSSHEDDFQQAMKQVIKLLWDCKDDPAGKALRNYEHYVSVVAANVRRKRIRDQHPEHQAVKDSLRHALKREPKFALWDGRNQGAVCGLAAWRGRDSAGSERLTQLLYQPLACEDAILPGRDAQRVEYAELLAAVFTWLGHPIGLNDLVGIVFDLKRIVEFTQVSDSAEEGAHRQSELLQSKDLSPEEKVRRKEFLEKLWAEIEQLLPLQRIAYLLNFTAGEGQLEVFTLNRIATIRQIGATLQLTDEQFERVWPELHLDRDEHQLAETLTDYDKKFALLWPHLPLEDKVIAKMAGTTPKYATKLRFQANAQLRRRLSSPDRST